MRISDDRYSRDRLRLEIALTFIRHEARTHTIRQWTGLSGDRIRKLYRAYLQGGGRCCTRHRGKSPQRAAYFLRTARLRQEAGAFAAIGCLLGLLNARRTFQDPCQDTGQFEVASVGFGRAVSLCQTYEFYCAIVASPAISFEHAVLLVNALARGTEVRLGCCQDCTALLVVDALALRTPRCGLCSGEGRRHPPACPPPACLPQPTANIAVCIEPTGDRPARLQSVLGRQSRATL